MTAFDIKCVLTTIEGPLSHLNFHKDMLEPYAVRMRRSFLEEKWHEVKIREIINELTSLISYDDFRKIDVDPVPKPDNLVRYTNYLSQKYPDMPLLKPLNELVWQSGYECGSLEAHVYYSVPSTFRKWQALGLSIAIYEHYSIYEQFLYFCHTNMGNLERYIDAHFDSTMGPMDMADSYHKIANEMNVSVREILFLTSVGAQAEAAAEAGLQVVVVQRHGNYLDLTEHQKVKFQIVEDFTDLCLSKSTEQNIFQEEEEFN